MDFNLDFELAEPESRYGPPKATVHRTGRLGFNQSANELLDFEENKLWKIGRLKSMGPEGVFNNDALILFKVDVEDDKTFKVQKSGDYFSLKTRRLWNAMGLDFRTEQPAWDIDEMSDKEVKYYKLTRRRK